MRKIFLIVLLKLLILHQHHGVAKAYPESFDSNEETVEVNIEDNNSMEELTTVINMNELSIDDENTPNRNYENIQHTTTTIATTLFHPTIEEQESSPIIMKLISESTKPSDAETTTELPFDIMSIIKNRTKAIYEEVDAKINPGKKGRILMTRPPVQMPRSRSSDSEYESSNSMEETTTIPYSEEESNETNIENNSSEEITTASPLPTSKRPPKNIEIFKTRPNELLRFYVEDGHLRSPIAALVDKKTNPLAKAKRLWKAALRPNSLLDIMVVSYDSEGIKSTYNLTNTKAMMTTLDKVRDENTTEKSKTYYSIIRTGQLIPFDSAIFITTDDIPNDKEHQHQASMFLLKKRIRLYLIIFDNRNNATNETTTTTVKETGFLGQLAMLTGGDIIYVPNYVFQNQSEDGEMGFITLYRHNKYKPIDQEPLKDFHENELKNDTETLIVKDDDHDSNN